MADLSARLRGGPCLLLDGGLGSMLLARGLVRGEAPERWNLQRPDLVGEVHRLYVAAGSEAVHANTFGANPMRLAQFGLADRCAELNRRAVEIARSAAPRFVLADIGPSGQYLPPVGDAEPDRWRDGFSVQTAALLEAGVDGIHLETMSDAREARIALEAVRDLDRDLPVLASLTFERKKRGFFTIMGDALVPALRSLHEAGATAVGANCSLTSGDMADLAAEAAAQLAAPLVFQPNAGQPRVEDDRISYAQDPAAFAADMLRIVADGAAAVGGCCGTDHRFIALVAAALRDAGPAAPRRTRP